MSERLTPLTLEGSQVHLVPLSMEHLDGLCVVGLDPDLWRWIPVQVLNRQGMQAYVELALDEQRRSVSLPFATTLKSAGRKDRLHSVMRNIDLKNRRVEIGATWIGRASHRSVVNTEAKYLMQRHAFETLHCARVELKTDVLNERSRKAIGHLGAKQEGILRRHVLTDTGRMRDTVYFSILDDEWPEIKSRLESRLFSSS